MLGCRGDAMTNRGSGWAVLASGYRLALGAATSNFLIAGFQPRNESSRPVLFHPEKISLPRTKRVRSRRVQRALWESTRFLGPSAQAEACGYESARRFERGTYI